MGMSTEVRDAYERRIRVYTAWDPEGPGPRPAFEGAVSLCGTHIIDKQLSALSREARAALPQPVVAAYDLYEDADHHKGGTRLWRVMVGNTTTYCVSFHWEGADDLFLEIFDDLGGALGCVKTCLYGGPVEWVTTNALRLAAGTDLGRAP